MVYSVIGKGQHGNQSSTITAIRKSAVGVIGSICMHHDLLLCNSINWHT